MKRKAIFVNSKPGEIQRVYGPDRIERIKSLADLFPEVIASGEDMDAHGDDLRQVEAIFSTWGMLPLKEPELARLPALKAVFYAAGSVKGFAAPLLRHGIQVVSAWRVNGIPVAEMTVAMIILSNTGYFRNIMGCKSYEGRRSKTLPRGPGNYRETVSLLGAGAIGRKVIEMLQSHDLKILVFDPYLTGQEAALLGVEKVSLEDAFARGLAVSNHIPLMPSTIGMIREEHFRLMREGSTFINTGRGATVDEEGMIRILQAKPSITALLDVTWPEPPIRDSELYTLPNVFLSSHIAGSKGNEVYRMADCCIEEFERWTRGEPLRHAVTLEMLERMA